MEEDMNGKLIQWKKISMEDDLDGGGTSIDDDFN